jgi:hypothetical protein
MAESPRNFGLRAHDALRRKAVEDLKRTELFPNQDLRPNILPDEDGVIRVDLDTYRKYLQGEVNGVMLTGKFGPVRIEILSPSGAIEIHRQTMRRRDGNVISAPVFHRKSETRGAPDSDPIIERVTASLTRRLRLLLGTVGFKGLGKREGTN